MKSSVEKLDPTRVKLSVEVPFAELKPSIDEAYKQIARQINVPGFRRGNVPAKLIDHRVGRPVVMQEAVNNSLDGFFRRAVEENNVEPLGQPEVEVSEVPGLDGKDEGELKFTVEVDCVPEVELPTYSDISVEVEPIEVTDEDVEAELDALRSRFGTLNAVDRPAANDDFVTLDLAAFVDDEEVDSANDVSYQVGSGTMLKGMDEALEGLSEGEETSFETQLAGGEHEGKDALVKITLKSVKERELAEADDDFAQMASEFDTMEELREDLKETAKRNKELEQGVEARDKVLEALLEKVDVPVPAKLVEAEVNRHLENEDRTEDDEHRKEVTEETERTMRTQFILDAIVKAESIEVSQQELIEYIMTASQQYGMSPQDFMQALGSQGQVMALQADVARRKGLASVLSEAKVVDTEGNEVDMTAFTTPAADEEEAAEAEAEAEEAVEEAEAAESAEEERAEDTDK